MSYHKRAIRFSGVFGTLEKVLEETDEAIEAEEQGNKILLLNELADIYLALKGVADKVGVSMVDLEKMAEATARAFSSGSRKPKQPKQQDSSYPTDVNPHLYCTRLTRVEDEVYQCLDCDKFHYGK
jgi:phosphoribosyl-ATP pyrophosphohydrolase